MRKIVTVICLVLSVFSVTAQVSVTATGGTLSATYGTMTAAFTAVNAGTHTGAITIGLTGNTNETAACVLNSSGSGSASYTSILIQPIVDGVTISGPTVTGRGLIELNGADNVTINGDNPNTAGTNKNLTITNTGTSTVTYTSVIRIAAGTVAPYLDNNNISIRNLVLNGSATGGNSSTITSTTGASNTTFGVLVGPNGAATPTAITSVTGAVNSSATVNAFTVDNCAINQAARGIAFLGNTATSSTLVTLSNNLIGDQAATLPSTSAPYTTPATTVYTKGIIAQGLTSLVITGNTIKNILSYVGTPINAVELVSGIGATGGSVNISNNTVLGVVANGATTANGILVTTTSVLTTISNNTITKVQTGNTGNVAGINFTTTASLTPNAVISLNKISNIYAWSTSAYAARGILITSGNNSTITNNFIWDLLAANDNSNTSTTYAVKGIALAAGSGHKVYHNTVNLSGALIGSGTNADNTTCLMIGTSGQTGIDIRNNIFANTITSATAVANACLQLPSGATSAMNLTLNNNAYYTGTAANSYLLITQSTFASYTAANFVPTATTGGTNARTYTSTLSSAGTNDNSSFAFNTTAPFASATNLHINTGTTATLLESKGVNIATTGVSTDIDGETRPGPTASANGGASAPDLGADEFDGVPAAPPTPPTISGLTVPTSQCTANSHIITATVVANTGTTTSVILNYSFNGIAQTAITMTNTSGTTWTGTIPAATNPVFATVTWSVTATNTSALSTTTAGATYSDAPGSGITTVSTPATATVCAGSPLTLTASVSGTSFYANSFETAVTDFVTSAVTGTPSLTQSSTYFADGTKSMYFNAGATADVSISSAANINLGGQSLAYLTFSHIAAMEGGSTSWDIGYVQYSSDGGTTWTTFPSSSYGGSGTLITTQGTANTVTGVIFSTRSYANWVSAFTTTGSTPTNALWQNETISIPAAALTSQFKLRFRYLADVTTNYYGWLIDNVKITNRAAPTGTLTYGWSDGTSIVGTTNPLTFNPASSATYSLTQINNCPVTTATGSVVTVSAVPTLTNVSATPQCGLPTFTIATAEVNPVVKWYSAASGGTLLSTGAVGVLTYTPAGYTGGGATNTIYATVTGASGCESARIAVSVVVNDPTPLTISLSGAQNACVNEIKTINVTSTLTNYGSYVWAPTTNLYTDAAATVPYTGSGSITTVYYKRGTATSTAETITLTASGGGCTATQTVNFTVAALPVISTVSATPATLCAGGTVALAASISSSSTFSGGRTAPTSTSNTTPSSYGLVFDVTTAFTLNSVDVFNGGSSGTMIIQLQNSAGTALQTSGTFTVPTGTGTTAYTAALGWAIPVGTGYRLLVTTGTASLVRESALGGFPYAIGSAGSITSGYIAGTSTTYYYLYNWNVTTGTNTTNLYTWTWSTTLPGAAITPGATSSHVPGVGTGTYTAIATLNGCSGTLTSSTVTVGAVPSAPTANTNNTTQCGAGIPTVEIGSNNGNGTFKWYDAPTGGNLVQGPTANATFLQSIGGTSGAPAAYNTGASSYTFYVSELNAAGCEGPRTALTVNVTTPPAVTATASAAPYCLGSTITLNAAGSGYTFTWSSVTPGAGLTTVTGASPLVTSATPTTAGVKVYNITGTAGSCSYASTVTVTVGTTPVIGSVTASPTTICGSGSSTLTALFNSGFSTLTAGAGASTTSGSGASGGNYVNPFNHYFGGYKAQYLFTKAELNALGLSSGTINSIAFDVTTAGITHNGFTLKIGATAATTLTSTFNTTALNQVYTGNLAVTSTGLLAIPFGTGAGSSPSFSWDGTSNVLIELCWSNANSGGAAPEVKFDATPAVSMAYYTVDSQTPATVCANTTATTLSRRPKIVFSGSLINSANSTPGVTLLWSTGATTNPLTVNLSTTTTYTVTATETASGCSSAPSGVTVTVNPLDPAPATQATAFVVNSKSTTSVTASYTASTSSPSGYLVVRYATGAAVTAPVNGTAYTAGGALGTGTVVYVGSNTTFTNTGLTAATTYDYYVYAYKTTTSCASNAYNTTAPLSQPVTTCTTATGTPGTPTLVVGSRYSNKFSVAWTASSTAGVSYILDVATNSGFTTFVPGYTALNVGTVLTTTVTGLSGSTTYYVRVRADLTACQSANSSSLTVITECEPEIAPTVLQPFTTFAPTCWSEATGALSSTTTVPTVADGKWVTETGFGNTGTNPAVRINLYSTSTNFDWAISQPINLGNSQNFSLTYTYGVTNFLGTVAQSTLGTHKVEVVISTDSGHTWSTANVLKTYTGAGTYSNTGTQDTINLSGYTGVVKIAFVSSTSSTSPDIDFHIDNFKVDANCPAPTAAATNLVLIPSNSSIAGSFDAATGVDGYLVVRTQGSTPSNPANGTIYTPGATALGGQIISYGTATSFTSIGLVNETAYTYTVFTYRSLACLSGPTYNVTTVASETTTTLGAPMEYISSTVTQAVTSNVFTDATNQQIIGIQIVTENNTPVLNANLFTFSTNGSTAANVPANITNAKLWYTGTSNVFSTTFPAIQFGNTYDGPPEASISTFDITGSQPLESGTNYFWLTYDIPSSATINDVVDAECLGIVLDDSPDAHVPTVTAPAGNRVIKSTLNGDYPIGPEFPYTNLTNAVSDLNLLGVSGPVRFLLQNSYSSATETYPITINEFVGASSTNTVTIQPGTGVTTSITAPATPGVETVIKINAADYVVIDGSNNNTTSRNLTIANLNPELVDPTAVVWIASTATDSANFNTVRNVNVLGEASLSTLAGIVVSGSAMGDVAEHGNHDILIENNAVSKSYYGIVVVGSAAPQTNSVVRNNIVGSATAANYLGYTGVFLSNLTNATVSNNTIFNILTNETNPTGIYVSLNVTNSVINANKIDSIKYLGTSGYGGKGIDINTGKTNSNLTVSNNMISRIGGDGISNLTNGAIIGIRIGATNGSTTTTGGINLYYNTINLSGSFAGYTSGNSAALYLASTATSLDIRNNLLVNSLDNTNLTSERAYAIYSAAANTAFTQIDYNNYYASGAAGTLGYLGANRNTLTAIQNNFGQNTNSVTGPVDFIGADNLHAVDVSNNNATYLNSKATTLAGVTTDFDGQARTGTPDIGADEFTTIPCSGTNPGTLSAVAPGICVGASTVITATGASVGVGTSYQWKVSTTSGNGYVNVTGGSGATTTSYTLPTTLTAGTYYYVLEVSCTSASTQTSAQIAITVSSQPTVTAASTAPVCVGSTVTLTGTVTGIANAYSWTGPNGFTSTQQNPAIAATTLANAGTYSFIALNNGCASTAGTVNVVINAYPGALVFASPVVLGCINAPIQLTASSTYPAASATSGTANLTTVLTATDSTLAPNPFQNYWGGTKQQSIYRAAELTALGFSAGSTITSIGVNFVAANSAVPLQNVVIKMAQTAATTYASTTSWVTAGLTTVKPSFTLVPQTGVNTLTFNTPFTWDGTSSLVLQFSYTNVNAPTTGTNSVRYTATPVRSTLYYRADNITAVNMEAYVAAATYNLYSRTDIVFNASGLTASAPITWNVSPGVYTGLYTDAAATVPYTGTATNTVYSKTTTPATYNAVASNSSACTTTGTVSTAFSNTWTGTTNTLWSVPTNWSCNAVPGAGTNVVIPNTGNKPVLDGNVTVGTMNLQAGATLSLGTNTFTINGAVSGTGTFSSTSSSNLTIAGTVGTIRFTTGVNTIKNLTLNAGATATLGNALNVTGGTSHGVVTVNAGGLLTTGGNLTLKSDFDGTASVAPGATTGNYITGNVTVERHIAGPPAIVKRAWRMLSIPTYGPQTIKQSWQENQPAGFDGNPGYGTNITGRLGNWASSGFDFQTASGNMQRFGGSVFGDIGNTNVPINTISGYFLYVRGDRSITPSPNVTGNSATTLRTTGSLYQGDQQIIPVPASQFALVGNVYASAIDWLNLDRIGVANTYYVWDPKLLAGTSLGAYQTFNGSVGYTPATPGGSYPENVTNTIIESGQAFFAYSSGSAGSIRLKESSKTASTTFNVFRPSSAPTQFKTVLYKTISGAPVVADASTVVFDNAYSGNVDDDDALKLSNFGENFGILRSASTMVVEARPVVTDRDTVYFNMWNMQQEAYKFNFSTLNWNAPGLTAFLEDSYLNTSTAINLSGSNDISFNVTNVAASSAQTRFRVVFRQSAPVPVTFTSVVAAPKLSGIQVDWKVAGERGITQYIVERSADGRSFSGIGTVAAAGHTDYGFFDANPIAGTSFYRIKSIDASGSVKYTNIVKVVLGNLVPSFTITPNPIENNLLNVMFTNQVKGRYTIRMINNLGQSIYSRVAEHAGGTGLQSFVLPAGIVSGHYNVEIISPAKTTTVQKVLVNMTN